MRRMTRRHVIGLGIGLVGIVGLPRVARAHAVIVDSKPKSGETVTERDLIVRLRFNSRIDHKRSRLILVGADRKELTIPLLDDTAPEIVSGRATLAASGAYRMRWQVLAIDGHITRGDIPFRVVAP